MSGTILLIEPDDQTRTRVAGILRRAFYRVIEAGTAPGRGTLDDLRDIDLVIVGATDAACEGISLCNILKSCPDTALIPVVIMVPSWADGGVAGFSAGAEDVLIRTGPPRALLARVRSLIRMKLVHDELDLRDQTARLMGLCQPDLDKITAQDAGPVVFAGVDEGLADKWRKALGGRRIETASRYGDILGLANAGPISAIVLHQDFGEGAGLQTIGELRATLATRTTPILYVGTEGFTAQSALAFDLGATDVLVPPFADEELAQRLAAQLRRQAISNMLRQSLQDQLASAVTDSLTGLHNRRYALTYLKQLMEQSRFEQRGLAVVMLDLDRFKDVDDSFGHATGDAVLREAASWIRASVRSIDLVARIGGEEFLVIMPQSDCVGAKGAAERIRDNVRRAGSALPHGALREITLSAGVAVTTPDDPTSPEALIDRADRALFRAKNHGRDQVSVEQAA